MKILERMVKTTFQRISRNPYHSIGAIFIMFLTFFVGGFFIIMSLWSNAILTDFESKPQINAFFKDSTTQEEKDSFENKLRATGNVAEIKFITHEEALEIYKENNKNDPLLTEFVTADILPTSFQISAININDLDKLAQISTTEEGVEEVVFQKEVVDALTSWTNIIRIIGIASVLFLIITSTLITLIVISLNISLHKEEIETMKLVGATKRYVRTPFILEGIFYGLAASLLATIFLSLLFYWITPPLQNFFQTATTISIDFVYFFPSAVFPINPITFIYLFVVEALAGIIIGAVGSIIATRKYLKV